MAGSTDRNPPIDVPAIDLKTGCWLPVWFDRQKYLDLLQPLDEIDFPHDDTKSDVVRAINPQSGTSYTFVLSDSGKLCTFSSGGATTVTVPPNSSVAFPVGTQIDVAQLGGKVTFAQGSGVTITSFSSNKALAGGGAGGTLTKLGTNSWLLVGSLSP